MVRKPNEEGELERDPAVIGVAIVTIIAVDIIIVVAVLIVNGIQNAVSTSAFLLSLLH